MVEGRRRCARGRQRRGPRSPPGLRERRAVSRLVTETISSVVLVCYSSGSLPWKGRERPHEAGTGKETDGQRRYPWRNRRPLFWGQCWGQPCVASKSQFVISDG